MLTSLSFHFKQAHSRLIVPVKLVYCNQISRRSFCSSNETNSIDFNDPNQWIKQQMYETYIKKPYQTLSVDLFRPLIQNHHDESKVQRILELYEQAKQSELIMPKTLDLFNMENLMHVIDDRFKVIAYFVYAARIERSRHRKTLIKKMKASLPPSFSSVPSVPSSSSLSSTLASSADLTRPDEMDAGNASRTGILFNSQGVPKYGLWSNTMFARRNNRPLTTVHQRRLLDSAFFGQKIIVDFAYEHLMPPTDYTGLCKQMLNMFVVNYEDQRPFDLWMCNLPLESRLRHRMTQLAPHLFHPRSLCSITHRSILDIGVDPSRLVYLSPDAPDKLDRYSKDDVYVLGAFVDRNDNRPESLDRARQANIRAARLPLEDHVIWTSQNANLPMYSVFRMLLHMKQSYGCWKHAILQFAPKCKQLDELETIAQHQPKVFERLLRSDYAYVKSRRVIRDRLLVNQIRQTGLL